MKQADIWTSSEFFAGQTVQVGIDFDRQYRARLVRQSRRQGTDTGADFEYHIGRTQFRRTGDQIN